MAELTNLETKVAEVIGLAQAAQGATDKIEKLVETDELKQTLQRMREEAVATEERTTTVVEGLDGKKTAILDKARETKQEATQMMQTYLGDDADGLDGFEFLVMAEAGEAGHWEVLKTMNERTGNAELQEVIQWAIPIQQRHFEEARQGSLQLAAEEDPNATAE
jgi:lantibiotic modifying enzyme